MTPELKANEKCQYGFGICPDDPTTIAALKPMPDAGSDARSNRSQLQKLIVEIAMALGVPCDNLASETIHAQYMELGERIKVQQPKQHAN